ncbi:hypothetical protein EVAR_8118_1 [Eumeta japonica]|uniref:Uncharacterized protein n=1 Tax=Eumeta variegata TaxID=151549 RepID=A0A4C1TTA3_EUMVA|nr:hypothetical protein EVAR_8118_1 [Eumeta japonica]
MVGPRRSRRFLSSFFARALRSLFIPVARRHANSKTENKSRERADAVFEILRSRSYNGPFNETKAAEGARIVREAVCGRSALVIGRCSGTLEGRAREDASAPIGER